MTQSEDSQGKVIKYWNLFFGFLWFVLILLMILKLFVYQQVTVVGKSMFPNYDNEQLLLVNQVSKDFRRGQVVALYKDREVAKNADYFTRFSAKFFLKRIICLPGEECEIIGGKVVVYNNNYPEGAVLNESYIPQSTIDSENSRNYYYPKTKIPENEYFAMGDNRSDSIDSRINGTFPEYSIFGQESFRVWPFNKVHRFALPEYELVPLSNYPDLEKKKEELLNFKSSFRRNL